MRLTRLKEYAVCESQAIADPVGLRGYGRVGWCIEGGYNLETLGETMRAHVAELQRQ